MEGIRSEVAEIKLVTTEDGVSGELLEGGNRPTSELIGRPVVETLLSVVVGIPQGVLAERSASRFAAHYLVPHIAAGVDAHRPSSCLQRVNHFL